MVGDISEFCTKKATTVFQLVKNNYNWVKIKSQAFFWEINKVVKKEF